MPLADRSALVLGAGREPGRAIAAALAGAGLRLIVVDLNPDAVARAADEIVARGGRAAAHTVDPSNKLALQTLLYTVVEEQPRLDLLVNAVHVEPRSDALRLDESEWNRTLDVNLKGPFLAAQTTARAMSVTGGGLIVNVVQSPGARHAAVRAARDGLLGLSAALAEEWAPLGIRVAVVEAGGTAAADVLRLARETWP